MVEKSEENVILLPIKPKFAESIRSGVKTVEFRKKAFARDIHYVVVYSSSPLKRVLGFFEVERLETGEPLDIWRRHRKQGGVSYKEFSDYYSGQKLAVCLLVKEFYELEKPMELNSLKRGLKPPQNYCYLPRDCISTLSQIIKHSHS